METQPDTYSIEELGALTGTSRRNIRFYIQEGLLPPPEGQRRGARYTHDHLELLVMIKRLQEQGLTLDGIRRVIGQGKVPEAPARGGSGSIQILSRLTVASGVELQIEAGVAGLSPEQVRELMESVSELYQKIKQRGDDHE